MVERIAEIDCQEVGREAVLQSHDDMVEGLHYVVKSLMMTGICKENIVKLCVTEMGMESGEDFRFEGIKPVAGFRGDRDYGTEGLRE